jgi:hypothetical protein
MMYRARLACCVVPARVAYRVHLVTTSSSIQQQQHHMPQVDCGNQSATALGSSSMSFAGQAGQMGIKRAYCHDECPDINAPASHVRI